MNPVAFEAIFTDKIWLMPGVIAVITGAHHEKSAAIASGTFGGFKTELPLTPFATPVGRYQLVIKANMFSQSELICGFVHVTEDSWPIGNGLFRFPRFEVIPQRMHVAI